MDTANTRCISLSERPWASRREYQRFFGPYRKDTRSGIYLSSDAPVDQTRVLCDAFGRLPPALRELCREYAVTFSFCKGVTAAGNSSTFYADFRQSSRQLISPHIEMSDHSLTPDLVLPHLTHEASHLWWRNLSEEARSCYRSYLLNSWTPETLEVTPYVEDKVCDWRKAMVLPDTLPYAENHRRRYLSDWTEESFCDTVAVLHVPGYPGRNAASTVRLAERKEKILNLTGLAVG